MLLALSWETLLLLLPMPATGLLLKASLLPLLWAFLLLGALLRLPVRLLGALQRLPLSPLLQQRPLHAAPFLLELLLPSPLAPVIATARPAGLSTLTTLALALAWLAWLQVGSASFECGQPEF